MAPRRFRMLAMAPLLSAVACGGQRAPAVDDATVDGAVGAGMDASGDADDADGLDLAAQEDSSIPLDVAIPPDATTSYTARCADPPILTWEGTGTIAVRVFVEPAADFDLVLPVAVTAGSATAGDDFGPLPAAVVVRAGASIGTFLVPLLDDTAIERRETLTLTMSSTDYVTVLDPASCTVSFDDDDDPTWPGTNAATPVDAEDAFVGDLSGLVVAGPRGSATSSLFAVQNNPGVLHQLVWTTDRFVRFGAGGFQTGKSLRYPSGGGAPDAESVTVAAIDADVVYVAAERDNAAATVSRNSILRYVTSGPAPLVATHEWDLTADLPRTTSNAGTEAITFVPDEHLVAGGFRDARLGAPYDPADYPDHAGGLFFVGLETNGRIYAYALDHQRGTAVRVSDFASGQAVVMGLEYDRDTGALYAGCDGGCDGRITVLRIEDNPRAAGFGRFTLRHVFERPTSLPDTNLEGIAVAPESECVGDRKPFYWTDDDALAGHSLHRDFIPCGRAF